MLDCENSGYPLGHKLYELRTVQLGGEEAAVVFDASDPLQMQVASLALSMATRIWAHSASVDAIMVVEAGLIDWDGIWAKMHDSVLRAKLADPKMTGSEADALKQLSADLLREYAVSPMAEKAKNELFAAMGCLTKSDLLTPPERNGWFRVNRYSAVMTRYAGSDVLDLAAVLRVLPPLPVAESVMAREREFQAGTAPIGRVGFRLDHDHVKVKIAEERAARAETQDIVRILSDGRITNPKSSDVLKVLPEMGIELGINRKTKRPSADKGSLEKALRNYADGSLEHYLLRNILKYRHHDTHLGLILEPFDILCEHGDGRMRSTVYTIEASTGRTSCRRFNAQQLSRQGGIRGCIVADPGYLGISADFEGCEIRDAAGLSGDRMLLEAETSDRCYLHDGVGCCESPHKGLHWMVAHAAFGKSAVKEHRYWSKRGVFTRLFGGGPQTAADQVYCDVKDMQKVWGAFSEIASAYTAWDGWLREAYKEGSFVWRDYSTGENHAIPIEGNRRMVYRTYSGRNVYITNGEHAAGNGAIQGTAREHLVDGLIKWRQTRWRDAVMLPVHDQLLGFVKAEEAEEASAALKRCMETRVLSCPGFEVVIGVDVDRPFSRWQDSS
jgi:DNA polymerase I-like protein with 3'-5' exonuclease and polymerase domains